MRRPDTFSPRRRLVDAAIILPICGAVLIFVPILWSQSATADDEPVKTSAALIYLFAVWAVMISGAGLLSYALRKGRVTSIADD